MSEPRYHRRGDKSACEGCRFATRAVDRDTRIPDDGEEFKGPVIVDTVTFYCTHPIIAACSGKGVSFIAERLECGFREERR